MNLKQRFKNAVRAAGIAALAAICCAGCGDYIAAGSNDDLGGGGGGRGNYIRNYKQVTLGSQTWLAENLDYAIKGSACYGGQQSNCEGDGRLYTWEAAKSACRGLYGDGRGWHLPKNDEWQTLVDFLGGQEDAAKILRVQRYKDITTTTDTTELVSEKSRGSHTVIDVGEIGCPDTPELDTIKVDGLDLIIDTKIRCVEGQYGFGAGSAGRGRSEYVGADLVTDFYPGNGYWWTATERGDAAAWYWFMYDCADCFLYRNSNAKIDMFSVRCVQD